MSFQAKLFLTDNEYTILGVEYALSRPMDPNNRPNGRLKGGIIDLTIETTNGAEILNWIVNNMVMDGRIEFYKRDAASSTQKIVEFKTAFCIYMKDQFVSDGANPMLTRITISALELIISDETIRNTWAGMESGSDSSGSSPAPIQSSTENTVSFE